MSVPCHGVGGIYHSRRKSPSHLLPRADPKAGQSNHAPPPQSEIESGKPFASLQSKLVLHNGSSGEVRQLNFKRFCPFARNIPTSLKVNSWFTAPVQSCQPPPPPLSDIYCIILCLPTWVWTLPITRRLDPVLTLPPPLPHLNIVPTPLVASRGVRHVRVKVWEK